ncbi:hypothetical protein XI09_17245 [Bradyrhizobium sp. CCBAU 11386]|uniref:hypothetical protein n=1 Tax=Bradyrhizobium sp. CCBAU 11386 TaxID=1630837 RepID=UPI0023034201|nr:hypothetical protein [Bradyrhizobium sp. CCBAU 11386]MDA9506345.1 hypothetical protein [Bradyrhizobium sp. CCBAU 11386]
MRIHRWLHALKALWQRLPSAEGYEWADKYPASPWLRRDIGVREDVVTREWNWVDEIRRKYSGWV